MRYLRQSIMLDNSAIIEILENISELLEIKGENVFKSRSYLNAARAIKLLSEEVSEMAAQDRLRDIPGVGEAIAKKLSELVATGRLEFYEKLKAEFPPGINSLLQIRGIGPRTAALLIKELNVSSAAELEQAILDGRVAKIPHLGEKSAHKLLEQIRASHPQPG
jgi:DNA polymerase (family X)